MLARFRLLVAAVPVIAAAGCANDAPVSPGGPGAYAAPESTDGRTHGSAVSAVAAQGTYHFLVPADFNGGIIGIAIDNDVSFVARRDGNGGVTGRFRYVQSAGGEDFIFSGTVTCLSVYDTPVLERFEDVPPMTHNRAKWGGLIEESNDPTLPAGGYLWFQSVDNDSEPAGAHTDLSTFGGFGDEAANEAFCASPAVPNPNFGPHAIDAGQIIVR